MTERPQFMDKLCTALGLPQGEVLKVADIMLEVWQGEANSRGQKRKRGAT
jgi:hypothetical protein